MKKLIFIIISSTLLSAPLAYADGKIVKWVDSKGVTHYGDRPPSFEESKSNVEMNKQGMVTKKNSAASPKDTALDEQKLAQDRKDKILLASYTSANEIDLARDRSLDMNKAALTSLAAQKDSLNGRIARNKQTADSFKARKKPLPAHLVKELKDAIAQSNRADKQIAERKIAMEQTRKTYAEDKTRFMALKQPTSVEPASSSPSPVAAQAMIQSVAEKK